MSFFTFNLTFNAGRDIHYQKGNKAPAASGKNKQLINMQSDMFQPKKYRMKRVNKEIPAEYCLPDYS